MVLEILIVLVLSITPVFELRGAIPYGILVSNINPLLVYLTAVTANILVIPLIFLFLDYIHEHLLNFQIYKVLFDKFVERSKHKVHKYTSKYGYLGLTFFVALPLPVTGAFTGTLAAWVLGLERKRAIVSLAAGVAIAGIIVTVLTLTSASVSSILHK